MTPRRGVAAVALIILPLCLTASAQLAPQAPTLTITPATVLTDERIQIVVEGLKANQAITIRAEGN